MLCNIGFCVFAVNITIAYHALLKSLVSYDIGPTFLFLQLSIRYRARILHSCIFSAPQKCRGGGAFKRTTSDSASTVYTSMTLVYQL